MAYRWDSVVHDPQKSWGGLWHTGGIVTNILLVTVESTYMFPYFLRILYTFQQLFAEPEPPGAKLFDD